LRIQLFMCFNISMKIPVRWITSLALALAAPAAPAGEPQLAAREMAGAAGNFLAALDAGQRAKAALPFAGAERENWHFVPKERGGVPLGELRAHQQPLAMALLASALSHRGLLQAATVMSLEQVLADIEKAPAHRDAGKYYFAVFGEPGPAATWGWRVEGHHLSVNLTLKDGTVAGVTPMFVGANPAVVREGPRRGLQALAEEENLARALVAAALADGREGVRVDRRPPADILTAADRAVRQLEPVGIPFGELSEAQQAVGRELVAAYAKRLRGELAAAELARIGDAGWEKVRFGWIGGVEPGQAYYYRLHGPTFLIEAANTQNNANHIHTVWRDPARDFGRDRLGEHYQGHDHPHD
jgi:hypothetical protein